MPPACFCDLRDGTAYFRGKVYAEEGRFRGDVYADNFYFNDGDDVRTLINEAGEVDFSKMKRIDLGGIVLDGETGNINFTGAGSITWGDNTPVKYQFGVSLTGPWHAKMDANDKYRRDSLDGGTTWGEPYQFKGTDGRNGSDANVPYYIKSTYISPVEIRSPTIKAAEFSVYPENENDYSGSYNIYGMHLGAQYHFLAIEYTGFRSFGDVAPMVDITSPDGADICLGNRFGDSGNIYIGYSGGGYTRFLGNVNLAGCTITDWGDNLPPARFA